MTKEQQDLAWQALPKEVRDEIKSVFSTNFLSRDKYEYSDGIVNILAKLFGEHNLTSDTEPSVQAKPKFKVGDKVYCKNIGIVLIVKRIVFESQKYELFDECDYGCGFWEWDNSNLEPYTEPETKDNSNMEEKELNLCELLKVGDTIYSPIFGDRVVWDIYHDRLCDSTFICYQNGKIYSNGDCIVFPSRALYEKYPLDAYAAWMEWKLERTPKLEQEVHNYAKMNCIDEAGYKAIESAVIAGLEMALKFDREQINKYLYE